MIVMVKCYVPTEIVTVTIKIKSITTKHRHFCNYSMLTLLLVWLLLLLL